MYCTRLSMSPWWRMARKRSNTADAPAGVVAVKLAPQARQSATAISTLSSVGCSKRRAKSCSATISCASRWFTKCAKKAVTAKHCVYPGYCLANYARFNFPRLSDTTVLHICPIDLSFTPSIFYTTNPIHLLSSTSVLHPRTLSFLRNDFRNCSTNRLNNSSPTMGNFVFTTAINAA